MAIASVFKSGVRVGQGRPVWTPSQLIEQVGSIAAMLALAAVANTWMAEEAAVEREAQARAERAAAPGAAEDARGQSMIGGYIGAPYTYSSAVHIKAPGEKTDFVMKSVDWEGKPFKSPIYYGVRVTRWPGSSRFGAMLDFTHSKTISNPQQQAEIEGLIRGEQAPAQEKIGKLFKHLEFSHGHNMLTLNGLMRLGNLLPRVSPYAGVGAGVALPHTEVMMHGEPARSYEYQYTGPVAQGLVGVEIRLAETSIFFEYKLTLADYVAPLTRADGTWLFADLWREFGMWWRGEQPPGGTLSTRLISHQVIGGAGYRF